MGHFGNTRHIHFFQFLHIAQNTLEVFLQRFFLFLRQMNPPQLRQFFYVIFGYHNDISSPVSRPRKAMPFSARYWLAISYILPRAENFPRPAGIGITTLGPSAAAFSTEATKLPQGAWMGSAKTS